MNFLNFSSSSFLSTCKLTSETIIIGVCSSILYSSIISCIDEAKDAEIITSEYFSRKTCSNNSVASTISVTSFPGTPIRWKPLTVSLAPITNA